MFRAGHPDSLTMRSLTMRSALNGAFFVSWHKIYHAHFQVVWLSYEVSLDQGMISDLISKLWTELLEGRDGVIVSRKVVLQMEWWDECCV